MKPWLPIATGFLMWALPAGASVLGDAAAALGEKEWVQLNPPEDFPPSDPDNDIYTRPFDIVIFQAFSEQGADWDGEFEWSDSASWDRTNRTLTWITEDVGTRKCGEYVYEEATNTWAVRRFEDVIGREAAPGHAYDHNAADPAGGRIFYKRWSADIWEGTWTGTAYAYTELPTPPDESVATSIEYIPWLNAGAGALLYLSSHNGSWWDAGASAWKTTGPTIEGSWDLHPHMEHSAADEFVMIAGGNAGLSTAWILDKDASELRTDGTPLPCEARSASNNLVYDYGSQSLLLWCPGTGWFSYTYDPVGDGTWTHIDDFINYPDYLDDSATSTSAAGIPAYGAVMVVMGGHLDRCLKASRRNQCGIYLFKLGQVEPDTLAPAPPENLTAT